MRRKSAIYTMCSSLALMLAFQLFGVSRKAPDAKSTTGKGPISKPTVINHEHFDGNAIDCIMTNDGVIVDHRVTGSAGMQWPKGTGKTIDYNSGLWLAGIGHDDSLIHTACSEYCSDLVPGLWGGDPEDEAYRIYKINSDGTGDWDTWPIDQGAPSENGQPLILGDQTLFWVSNDGDSAHHWVFSSPPMDVEIRYIVFGFDHDEPLGNTMFIKWEIINRGTQQFDSCFVGLWDDPDLGDATDDHIGCDTTLNIGYCYNADPYDSVYGATPPALGFDFLQGPEEPLGSGNHLPMTAFVHFIIHEYYDHPETALEAHLAMRGYGDHGVPYFNHLGEETKFPCAGDPVTGIGDLDDWTGDRWFLMSSGPFTFAPGDTQVVVGAKIIAQGADHLDAVASLRSADAWVQNFYDTLTSVERTGEYAVRPARHRLYQNSPNPFNEKTTIRFEIPQTGLVSLCIYNVSGQLLRELMHGYRNAGCYRVTWDGRDSLGRSVASGVYFYSLKATGYRETRKMVLLR